MYSMELKLEIVQRYLKGDISIKQLADEYHISSKACIQKWLALYREHGETGLCTTHGTYSGDFKVSVIEYMHHYARQLPILTYLPKNLFQNGKGFIIKKAKMPCMRNEEEGHQKWKTENHEKPKQM